MLATIRAVNVAPGWWLFFIGFGLVLVGIAVAGGGLTAYLARRRGAFAVGLAAFVASTAWLRRGIGIPSEDAIVGGWLVCGIVGFALRRRQGAPDGGTGP